MDHGKITGRTWWWILPLLFLVVHAVHGFLRHADPDEFQALTNAFDASRGLLPYVDFWDNHGPLNIWLLQPVLALWNGGHSIITLLRAGIWLNTIAIVIALIWTVRRLYPALPRAPAITALFLLSAPPFLAKSIELRGDNPANLLGALALVCLIFGQKSGKAWFYLAAGLCIGIMAGFTLKAIIAAAALGLFYICWHVQEKQWPRIRNIMLLFVGAAIPVILIWSALWARGSWNGFINCYFGGNVSRPFPGFTSSEITGIFEHAPAWTLWTLVMLFVTAYRIVRGRADGIELGLWAMVIFFIAQFLLFMPTKNLQSLLPAYFPLAVLAGRTTAGALAARPAFLRTKGAMVTAMVVVLLVLLRDVNSTCNLRNHGLQKQVHFADEVLGKITDQRTIFDPSGAVFLKPKPGPFHIIVTFIREMHQSGAIDLAIPSLLENDAVKFVIFDDRTNDLRRADIDFLVQNYQPVLKGRDSYLLQVRTEATTSLSPGEIQNWLSSAYDDAEIPTEDYKPPAWYADFMAQYRRRQQPPVVR